MSQFDIKMTELADAIKVKNTNVSGKLSVQGMIDAVSGIVINPPSGEGADVSGVTAKASDVLNTVKFVDNTGTLQSGTIATVTPSVSENIFTVSQGYVASDTTLEIPEMTIVNDGTQITVPVGYNKTEQVFQVGGGGTDTSDANITAADVRMDKIAYGKNGKIVGEMNELVASPIILETTDEYHLPDGYYADCSVVISSDTLDEMNIRAGSSILGIDGAFSADATATAADILEGKTAAVNGRMITGTLKAGGGDEGSIKFGYWTEDGKFQELDLSGDAPVDSGEPVSVDAITFKTGKTAPDYGGGGEDKFYMASSFQGVLSEVEVTDGSASTYEHDFPISLVGKYTIVDPGASGTDRKWVCNATIAGEDQESAKVYLRTFDYMVDFDADFNEIYEKRWGFALYDDSYIDSSLIYSNTTTGESPFSVTEYSTGMDTATFVKPVFAPAVDEPPYGVSAWNGKRMIWGLHPIYITYCGKLESCNGYWIREDEGQELSLDSTWVNLNGLSRIAISSKTDQYVYWNLYSIGKDASSDGKEIAPYYMGGGSNSFLRDQLIHPFSPEAACRQNSSSFLPVPTMLMAFEGYYPSDVETTDLPIKRKSPQIGNIYNGDATVKIATMYPGE